MTLLSGPPGSGKTALLLALAGKLSSDINISGSVTYNGHGMDEFVPQRTASYISQNDLHIGEMTARETSATNMSIDAEAHVGSRGLPTFINSVTNVFEAAGNAFHILPNKKKLFSVLHDVSGIIKPRRMTLLLDPPGFGKTTLFLALAGKLSSDLKIFGNVTYNSHGMDEFVLQSTAAYISQHDLHIEEMSARETLAFSAICQRVSTRYEMLTELIRREKAANIKPDPDIDVFMKAALVGGRETNSVTDYILKEEAKDESGQRESESGLEDVTGEEDTVAFPEIGEAYFLEHVDQQS